MQPFAVGVVEASPKSSPEGKDLQPILNPSLDEPTPNPFLKEGENASFAKTWGAHTADSMQYDLLKKNAIENRKNPTEAESVLWDMLKGNNLGYHFRRQHIILDYIVDFVCLEKGLVIELDGGYHNDPQQKAYDGYRTAHLQRLGYTELRFKNEELLCAPDAVTQKIKETLESLPSINSLPFREGQWGGSLPSLQEMAGDRLVGLVVGYITKEKNPIKQFLTRRAIIIGGPLLAEDISKEALAALLKAVRAMESNGQWPIANRPIYIETRNFNDYSRWKSVFEANGFVYKEHLNFHVDCTQENMLATMSESRRRQIKKAIKSGVAIVEAQSQEDVRTYYDILKDLYKNKVKTPLFPLDFFLRFYENGFGKYLLVKYEDKIIGGIMCPILKGRTIYEWFVCGMDEQYKNQYPSVMATYAAIEYAQQNGLSRFDFMGAGKPEEAYGVRDFKARFGGEQVEHGRFLCVRKPLLYWIGKMGVKILKRR
jgi:very-short-patch-repair endonuclease